MLKASFSLRAFSLAVLEKMKIENSMLIVSRGSEKETQLFSNTTCVASGYRLSMGAVFLWRIDNIPYPFFSIYFCEWKEFWRERVINRAPQYPELQLTIFILKSTNSWVCLCFAFCTMCEGEVANWSSIFSYGLKINSF